MSSDARQLRPPHEKAPDGGAATKERRDEVHAADLRHPRHARDLLRAAGQRADGPDQRGHGRAHERPASYVGTQGLADAANAKTRAAAATAQPAVTDGPFAEAKEQLGGYVIVDCEPRARARASPRAGRSSARGAMEVRPSWTTPARRCERAPGRDGVEDLLRRLAPQVLGALVRRHGQFDACEDAVQEALIAAAAQWPAGGRAGQPARLADRRRRRGGSSTTGAARARGAGARRTSRRSTRRCRRRATRTRRTGDDTLALLFLCCHPALTPPSQIALTLRAVGGLTTDEIARAFLVPEATMAQRISRAKQRIKASGGDVRHARRARARRAAAAPCCTCST